MEIWSIQNITENVNLPIPLLTRFDLIFVVRDIPTRERDMQIAKHIIRRNTSSGTDKNLWLKLIY